MSCVMRADGASFDVDVFCASTVLPVVSRHHAGEPRFHGSIPSSRSSINVAVSDAPFDALPQQVADAIAFLVRHTDAVRHLVAFPGVEGVTLDFGVNRRDVAAQTDSLPARLVSLAGALGLGLTVTQYEIAPS